MLEEIKVEGAAEGYVELFNRYGVDYVISSPGTEFVPIWEYLAKYNSKGRKPFYINARHEGTALTVAKGYAMVTGRPQVVLTHVLVGLLHGAMELRALYTDNIPAVLMVGQAWTHDEEIHGGTPGPHYFSFTQVGGQQRLVQPFVKWSESPATNENILEVKGRALDIASADIKGPVLLAMSRELLFEKTKKMRMPRKKPTPTRIQADPGELRKLADLLAKAENPLIYTRHLGRDPESVSSLVELAQLASAPVFETPGYMNFPTNNPLHMGYDVAPYLTEADLVLVIDGSSWPPWYPPKSISQKSKAKIVFMDLDPLQSRYPSHGYPADMLITADSGLAVPELSRILRPVLDGSSGRLEERLVGWSKEHARIRDEWRSEALAAKDDRPIDPRWLCHVINEVVGEDTLTVHETITHGRIVHRYVEGNRTHSGTHFEAVGPVAHTGLGQELGVALGVKLANPEKTVIALEGDGSFNYNPVPASFGLSQEYGLPFLTVIFDNLSYAAMRHHSRFYPKGWSVREGVYHGVHMKPKPDYPKLAEAFGGYGETVEEPSEVRTALLRAVEEIEGGRLALLDVVLKSP
jgi:thiamine pyrophosphate-dependent acetolactate synthase large subunit-like protein